MSEVARILSAIEEGDPRTAGQLLPLVYEELRQLAAHLLAQEKPGQTLQATALVHEAFNADIFKRVGGVITQLATLNVGSGAGVLRFTLICSQLELYFGGVKKLSVSDFSLKSGSIGIRSSLDPTLDDFNAARAN